MPVVPLNLSRNRCRPLKLAAVRRSVNGVQGPVLFAAGTFVVGVDGYMLPGVLPALAADLDVPAAVAAQLTTVFALVYTIGSPLIAASAGARDRRVLLLGGMALFAAGTLGQAVATDFPSMALARGLAALGAAAFQPTAFAVVSVLSAERRRGRALSMVGSGMMLANALGAPMGLFLAHRTSWRLVLLLVAAGGVLVAVLLARMPRVRIPAAGLRVRLAVLVRPSVAHVLGVSVLASVAWYVVIAYLPVVLGRARAGTIVSWVFFAFGAGQVAGNVLAGRAADRWGPARVVRLSLVGSAVVLLAVGVAITGPAAALLGFLAGGVCNGMLLVPQQKLLHEASPGAPAVAVSLNGSAVYAGAATGTVLGAALLGAGTQWLGYAGAAAAGAGLLWQKIRRTRKRDLPRVLELD